MDRLCFLNMLCLLDLSFHLALFVYSYSKLQDLIASCTDIPASKQLLLASFNGRPLEELVDVLAMVEEYPAYLLTGCLYLFQLDVPEASRLTQPEVREFIPHPCCLVLVWCCGRCNNEVMKGSQLLSFDLVFPAFGASC